ncbi:MAG: hypothetical protein CMO80_13500 [Verrucomicrobiales bacterium]|nr:hypothetical protein [Verrucomicrobiales bacterium]|tara:strand:+ start:16468 stop:16824 length:357 start_codon:yes stop_codon:yes gene_type:complete
MLFFCALAIASIIVLMVLKAGELRSHRMVEHIFYPLLVFLGILGAAAFFGALSACEILFRFKMDTIKIKSRGACAFALAIIVLGMKLTGNQFVVRSAFQDPTIFHHHNQVGHATVFSR